VDYSRCDVTAERYFGEWWKPEAADRRVPGSLDTKGDGPMRLELLGLLTDGHPDNRYAVVLGTTADGVAVTLEGLQQIGQSTRSSRTLDAPVETEVFAPQIVYLGAHLPSDKDRTFRLAVIDFTDLIVWAGASGIDETYGPEPMEVSVWVTRPPALRADLPFGRLSLQHGWRVTGDGMRSRGIEKSVGFFVELDEPVPMTVWLSQVVNPLRHFLTFATDRPNEVAELTFKTFRYDEVHGSDVHAEYRRGSVLASLPPAYDFEFLFDARALGSVFPSTMKAWLGLYHRLGPVLDLFFGPRYRPTTFIENHFLNAVGAAEGYHRATVTNAILPPAEHRARVQAVVDASPSAHQAWLKQRLAYSNEPTLRDRFMDLHARSEPIVAGILGSAPAYADPVVRMRNALTHRGKGTPKSVPSGRELLRLTEQTNFLLTTCLLLDLGLGESFVLEATRRSRRFRLLTEVLR
jgi:hypothetical protein